ncbi:MAG: glycosyltransferase family 2 protein [Hyphomonadaceae bacterium]
MCRPWRWSAAFRQRYFRWKGQSAILIARLCRAAVEAGRSAPVQEDGMSAPIVTAAITAYNRPDFLKQAIESVLSQTFQNIEIVVVDDCSPADLRGVADSFGGRVRYFRHAENKKLSHARNTAISLAQGKYIAFLDDDDAWLPEKIAAQISAIGERDACLCGFSVMESGRTVTRRVQEVTSRLLLYGNKFCGPSGLLCRRDVLLEEPFDASLRWGEDWDLYVRLSRRMPLAYVAQPLFLRRTSDPQSMTNKTKVMSVREAEDVAGPLRKQRAWLGDRIFYRRLAGAFLSQIRNRPNKWRVLSSAISEAGIGAALWCLWYKALRGDRRLWLDSKWNLESGAWR